jgi:hypothetical protein
MVTVRYHYRRRRGNSLVLALEQRDRVRRVRLWVPSTRIIHPGIPDHGTMAPSTEKSTTLPVPSPTTLQAPHLRHLLLSAFTLPIGSCCRPRRTQSCHVPQHHWVWRRYLTPVGYFLYPLVRHTHTHWFLESSLYCNCAVR